MLEIGYGVASGPAGRRSCRTRTAGPRAALFLSIAVATGACGSDSPGAPTPTPPVNPPAPSVSAVLVGAGDIADCTQTAVVETAKLVDSVSGTVFTAGDNVYNVGTLQNYTSCYGPNWGRHLSRTRPSPGNHDYDGSSLAAYLTYFSSTGAGGPEGQGYYSYEAGAWHVIALNSNIAIGAGSQQLRWLQEDLAASTSRCTLAYWHHPLFSSAQNGPQMFVKEAWQVLYQAGVEIVLNGHDHVYERFRLQDPDGRVDNTQGIRQFTVGTGGSSLYSFVTTHPGSEVRSATHGVLRLDLQTNLYSWQFIPIAGKTFTDSGYGTCH